MSQQAGLPGLRARDSWTIISMFWTWNQDDKALLSSSKHFKRGTCKISSPAIVTQRYKPWVKTKTPYQPLLGSSVQFSRSVVSDSLRPHEPQHARPPCPSPTPGVYPNTCPSSWWCHPTISSSVVLFSSCPQSLPASGSFPMSQLFTWGGQSTGVSASASVLPMNTQEGSPLGWTGWISSQSKGLSRVFSNTTGKSHYLKA